MLVLLLVVGLLELMHRDVVEAAENLLLRLHIGLDRRVSRAVLEAAARVTDGRLWALVAAALAYSTVRFAEAWGLWRRRAWAEWVALLSGLLYLPWELQRLLHRPNWLHAGIVAGNLAIVAYIARHRALARRRSAP